MNKFTELLSYKETIRIFVETGLTNFYNLNTENTHEIVAVFVNDNTEYLDCLDGLHDFEVEHCPANKLVVGLLLDNEEAVNYSLKAITNKVIDFYAALIQYDLDEKSADFKVAQEEEKFIKQKRDYYLAGMGHIPPRFRKEFGI